MQKVDEVRGLSGGVVVTLNDPTALRLPLWERLPLCHYQVDSNKLSLV